MACARMQWPRMGLSGRLLHGLDNARFSRSRKTHTLDSGHFDFSACPSGTFKIPFMAAMDSIRDVNRLLREGVTQMGLDSEVLRDCEEEQLLRACEVPCPS